MPQPLVFISYSHRDGVWKDRLLSHLRPLEKSGVLGVWHDGMLTAGSDWLAEIRGALSAAKVAILLITADFLGSDFIQRSEVADILERRQREGLHVIPVIVKSCLWQNIDWLSAMQVRPLQGKPLAEHRGNQRDTQLTAIAAEVNRYITNDPGVARSTAPPLPPATRTIEPVDGPRTIPAPVSSPPPWPVPVAQPEPVPQPRPVRREFVLVGALLAAFLALLVYQLQKPRVQGAVTPTTTETVQKKDAQTDTTATTSAPLRPTGAKTKDERSLEAESKPVLYQVSLWPDSTIPYVIAADVSNQSRVTDAILDYEKHTNLRFVPRINEANYVRFRAASGCSSSVGMSGGEQYVNLAATCATENVLHLLGHVLGLHHEASRPDRDQYVKIDWTKVQPSLTT